MEFFFTLLGDALLFASLCWFAGYGALGPATGIRLGATAKLRLFGEVLALTAALLYLFIATDRLLGWVADPPWPGTPPPHRLVALAALLTVGFLYTRRRARALHSGDAPTAQRGSDR
jgi:hypothetical protein